LHIPKKAPSTDECWDQLFVSATEDERHVALSVGPCDEKGNYIHWDKLRFKHHPEGISPQLWWAGMKFSRTQMYKLLPSVGLEEDFCWCEPSQVSEALHWLDVNAAGVLSTSELITSPESRNTYLVRSLVDEAISSSQLEGASTTVVKAREMIRENRAPEDKDQSMILNNYHAMSFIREMKGQALTPALVRELHKIVTENTLEDPAKAGQLRDNGDDIKVVATTTGEVLHIPPKASLLEDRLKFICDFANGDAPTQFVHPVIRAIITHFLLAYDHPFVDGNGRTARALFYWVMLRKGYWLMEYITISKVIKRAPRQYGKAYLYAESDENDITYFILQQLGVIKKAIEELQFYLERKQEEIRRSRQLMANNPRLLREINSRQLALLRHAIKNPRHAYRIEDHMRSHGISYETARKDLIRLSELKTLKKVKSGKAYIFTVPADLQERLAG